MSGVEREPTQDELSAMAYVDGELAPPEMRAFESRMQRDAALAREVAELRGLAVLARHAAGPEPMDFEWERIARSSAQRTGVSIAWTLIVVASLGLLAWGVYEELCSSLALAPKILITALIAGLALLLYITAKNRMRTLPFDPYTKVKR